MSINFVSRAIQSSSSSVFAAPDSVSLFGNIVSGSVSFFEEQSLVGRTVFLTATGLTVASFIAHYKASSPKAYRSLFSGAILSMLASFVGGSGFLSAFFLNSLVQFKTAFTVLPYFNASPSESAELKRVMQGAYTVLKYAASTIFAIDVFRNCNRNVYCGLGYGMFVYIFFSLSNLVNQATYYPKTDLENIKSQIRQDLGSDIVAELFHSAIATGIGGAVLYNGGLTCISGFLTQSVYDCLSGVSNISLAVGVILPRIRKWIDDQRLLDQYSCEFIERFSIAVCRAKELSEQFPNLNYVHFRSVYHLALGYSTYKNHPEQKQRINTILRWLPPDERVVHFLENQPFLDGYEIQELFETYQMKAWNDWNLLNSEQFQQLFLPKIGGHILNENGLQKMQADVETLKSDLMEAANRYADLEAGKREVQIYKEIEKQHKKIVEYSSSIYDLNDSLDKMDPEKAALPDMKQYATELKNLTPQIALLNENIIELERLIEEHTGDLTKDVSEAIGLMGFRVKDCKDMLETLQLPSEQHFKTVSQLFAERGVKNQYDLIKKGILVQAENLEKLKKRLIEFLLNSDQPLQSVPAPVQHPSAASEMSNAARKIYKYVAFPFFCALQIYARPVESLVGITGGVMALMVFEYSNLFIEVMCFPEAMLYNSSNYFHAISYIFLQAQLTIFYFTRFGDISALLLGPSLPYRAGFFLESIR